MLARIAKSHSKRVTSYNQMQLGVLGFVIGVIAATVAPYDKKIASTAEDFDEDPGRL